MNYLLIVKHRFYFRTFTLGVNEQLYNDRISFEHLNGVVLSRRLNVSHDILNFKIMSDPIQIDTILDILF